MRWKRGNTTGVKVIIVACPHSQHDPTKQQPNRAKTIPKDTKFADTTFPIQSQQKSIKKCEINTHKRAGKTVEQRRTYKLPQTQLFGQNATPKHRRNHNNNNDKNNPPRTTHEQTPTHQKLSLETRLGRYVIQ